MVFGRPPVDCDLVGVVVSYETYAKQQLQEYFKFLNVGGDFRVIHVLDNPLNCYCASVLSRISHCAPVSSTPFIPLSLDCDAFIKFVQAFAATASRVYRELDDQVTVDMVKSAMFEEMVKVAFEYLEKPLPDPASFLAEDRAKFSLPDLSTVLSLVPTDVRSWVGVDYFSFFDG
jgi:hypothetical protein